MLYTWLSGNTGATWEHIVAALREMNLNSIARNIEAEYRYSTQEQKSQMEYISPPTSATPLVPATPPPLVTSPGARGTSTLPESTSLIADSKARKILEEALLKGYVLLTIIKCLILGAAGSGKTHVKHVLLNEEPPEDRISTALAEPPIRAVSRVVAGAVRAVTGWFRITHDELMKLLAQALKAGVPMEIKDETVHEHHTHDTDDTVRHSSELKISEASRFQDHQRSSIRKSTKPSQHTSNYSPASTPEVSPSQDQLVRLVEQSTGSKRFLELQWIHFIDSGGQPQFHEVLPAFIRNTSSTMVVVKLSESLDHCPTMEYYDRKGECCGEPCPYFLRNDQILQHCTQTAKSQPSFQNKGGNSKILVVGTHQDHEDKCPETRAQKNEKLRQILMPSLRKELVFYRLSSPKEVIFPMNVKTPSEQDRNVAAMLREAIADEKTAPPPYKVPIGWFLLEEDIRQLRGKVVSKEECLHVASRLKINKKGLDAALIYLDELNIFLYYPSLLPQVVFSDPQVLLDKITELVAFSYSLRCGSAPPGAFGSKWLQFRDEGIVTVEMLLDKRFSSHYVPGLFEPSDLIKLFEKLLILSPLSSSEFFMPSLLAMISPCETKQYQVSLCTPLLVHYPSGCAQHGIFCGLVVHLHSSCRWNISYQADDTPVCVSRNCIVFQLPGRPVTVTLIDSFSYLEVHITAPDCMYAKFCPEVRKSIFMGLEKAAQAFHYNESKPQVAFFCNCSSPAHAATPYVHGQDRYLVCTKTSNYTTLENKHSIWLEESAQQAGNKRKPAAGCGPEAKTAKLSPSIDQRPSLKELLKFPRGSGHVNILQEIGRKHTKLSAFLLNDETGTIADSIAKEQMGDVEDINTAIVSRWLQGKGRRPVTWRTLVEVLRDAGLTVVADDIETVKCESH